MKPSILALAGLLFLAACSKVNQENFAKVQEGMSEQEVIAILGTPTESNSVNIAVITVRFVNGKAALKTFDQPGVAEIKKGRPEGALPG
jgi:SmpA / OmlA family